MTNNYFLTFFFKGLAIASLITLPFFSKAQQSYRSSGDSSRLGYFYGDQVLDATTSPDLKNAGKFTLNFYGSGDADGNDTLDLRDYNAINYGTKNNQTDINGDGKSDNSDLNLLNDFLTKKIKYLPSHWNLLQTKTERENWLQKMLAIDKTDEKTYVAINFDCNGFAKETSINFSGIERIYGTSFANDPYYDTTKNMQFNIPIYEVTTTTSTGVAHRINAVLVGEDITNFNDWYFLEPQTDGKVIPGDQSMNKNKPVNIDRLVYLWSPLLNKFTYAYRSILDFNLSNGSPSLSWKEPKAIHTRTIIPIYFNDIVLPKDTILEFGNFSDTSKTGIPKNIYEKAWIEVIDSSNQTNIGDSSDVNYTLKRYFKIQNHELVDTLIGPQLITIQDKTKPSWTFFPSDTTIVNSGQKIDLEKLAQPTAKDNSNLPVDLTRVVNSNQDSDSTKCGYYNYLISLNYLAKDVSGNIEVKTRKIEVKKIPLTWEFFPSDTIVEDTSTAVTGVPTTNKIPYWSSPSITYVDQDLGKGIYNRIWTANENICDEKISRTQKVTDKTIGISENNLEKIIVSNSSNDKIIFSGNLQNYNKINWQLYDLNGKLIDFGKDEWYSGENREDVNISNLKAGLYHLKIHTDKETYFFRIIKN